MSMTPLERITWSLFCPFPRVRAQAEFTFAEKSRGSGTRYPKLRGGSYTAKRYSEAVDVTYLDLGTDDYFILKHNDFDFKKGTSEGKVVMSYPHLRRFVEGLEDMLDVARDGCFEEVDGAYQLTARGAEAVVHVTDMFNGASVAFSPIVFTFQPEDEAGEEADFAGEPGVRMFLNSPDMYSDVTLDEFATFVQFCERFDLFATARSAVQVAAIQTGGVAGVTMTKTPLVQPTRRPAATGLGAARKITKGKEA